MDPKNSAIELPAASNEPGLKKMALILFIIIGLLLIAFIIYLAILFLNGPSLPEYNNVSHIPSNCLLDCTKSDLLEYECMDYLENNLTKEDCLALSLPNKDNCLYKRYMLTRDSNLCNLISDDSKKVACQNSGTLGP